jgi:heme-degrading monooxygenase HmoA
MIPEVAILDVIPDKTAEFEVSFQKAQRIISSMNGWLGHQLQHAWKFQTALFYQSDGRR